MKLRKATAKDIEGIYSVMEKAGYIAAFYGGKPKESVIPKLLGELFGTKSNTEVIIGEEDGEIIAYSIFGPYAQYKSPRFPEEKENFAYCMGFGVDPKFSGKGYGTLILLATEDFEKKEGYKGVYTDVASNNKASLRVHEKAKYEKIAEVSDPKRPVGVKSIVFKKVF